MNSERQKPGPLAQEKQSDAAPTEPSAAETESARLLANQARSALKERGLPDHAIDRLAEVFIAQDRSEDLDAFIAWAVESWASERARPGR
jgi:deoxyhypusine synthase